MTENYREKPGRRPGRGWYVFSLILFLAGVSGAAAIFFTGLFSSLSGMSGGTQFMVPGSVMVTIEEPGKYILWDEIATMYQGERLMSSEELPPGVGISVIETQSGRSLPVLPTAQSTETVGFIKRKAINSITFDKPGIYTIDVSGDFEERVFFLRRSLMAGFFTGLIAVAVLGFIGLLVAPAIAVTVFIIRSSSSKPEERQPVLPGTEPTTVRMPKPGMDEQQEKNWAMFCHLGTLLGYIIPFANLIVPLVIWQTKKNDSPFIALHGKEALNF
ncbi:MAG: DUF4870 domain-containing protein, partial [bacterium]